jgi:hypothetical protein
MSGGDSGHVPSARETARYIEQFAHELRAMAQKADFPFLAFLLGMAEDEAGATLRRLGGPSNPA